MRARIRPAVLGGLGGLIGLIGLGGLGGLGGPIGFGDPAGLGGPVGLGGPLGLGDPVGLGGPLGLVRFLVPIAPAHAASSPERAEAMKKLAFMNGVWRGPASGVERDGTRFEVVQTERMGPMLDGDVIVIEGRGYNPDGTVGFNALGIVSWDQRTNKYEMRSYARGYAGTFEMKLTENGFVWEIPAGPGGVVRYTATIQENTWVEVGEYIATGAEPSRMFEMKLERVGDTTWPEDGAIPMK